MERSDCHYLSHRCNAIRRTDTGTDQAVRASTDSQDASRAREPLIQFAADHGHRIAAFYTENESGAKLERPELFHLLDDSHEGDILLVEGIDRLSRLTPDDWAKLKTIIAAKKVTVVSMDLTTSHGALKASDMDDFTKGMIAAVNGMLLDMLAVIARKDYEDRRRRQAKGIEKVKAINVYRGRPVDAKLHNRIKDVACLFAKQLLLWDVL